MLTAAGMATMLWIGIPGAGGTQLQAKHRHSVIRHNDNDSSGTEAGESPSRDLL